MLSLKTASKIVGYYWLHSPFSCALLYLNHFNKLCLPQSALSMLESGENPNQYSEDGFTPICLAAFWGKSDIVKALLNFG